MRSARVSELCRMSSLEAEPRSKNCPVLLWESIIERRMGKISGDRCTSSRQIRLLTCWAKNHFGSWSLARSAGFSRSRYMAFVLLLIIFCANVALPHCLGPRTAIAGNSSKHSRSSGSIFLSIYIPCILLLHYTICKETMEKKKVDISVKALCAGREICT